MSTVGRWIHAAVTRNVKQLHLEFRPGDEDENIEMSHCMVTSGSLEVLTLFLWGGCLRLPNFTGFPSLRVLELNRVTLFNADLVEAFFKSLTLLEDLSLIDCYMGTLKFLCISCLKLKNLRIDNRRMVIFREFMLCGDLQISCLNLVFLELAGNIANKYFFDTLDSLKKAVIHPREYYSTDPDSDSEPEHMDNTLCELFARISHVEFLSINSSFVAKCIDPEVDVAVSLPNLKTLELTLDCITTNPVQFIRCFPDLESLHLYLTWDYYVVEYWNLDDDATMRILTCQLKKVDYLYFGVQDQLQVASFFLEHGNALEEMVISWASGAKFHKRSVKTMKKLSKFHKASSTVKLIPLLKNWPNDFMGGN